MKLCKCHTILTLTPKSREEQRLFWEFRCKDVRECYHYVAAFGAVVILVNLIVATSIRDKKSLDNLFW